MRPRVAIYSVLLIAVVGALIFSISQRQDIDVTVLRAQDNPYQVVMSENQQEEVINHFKMHMKNHTFDNLTLKMILPSAWKDKNIQLISQSNVIDLKAGTDTTIHFFLKFPKNITGSQGAQNIQLDFVDTQNDEKLSEEDVKLVGPKSI